jgi:predicted glycogen debranching enzyme
MTFGLTNWLKSSFSDLNYEVPLCYPTRDKIDTREWFVANGLGGYSSSTLCGAHTRRYHGLLVASFDPPRERHVIFSRADEVITIQGKSFKLATNIWESGVVAPTGYKLIESFTYLPNPTWTYELDGHYVVKQLALDAGSNDLYLAYWWFPDPSKPTTAQIDIQFLIDFRDLHDNVRGDASKAFPQVQNGNHTAILLNDSNRQLFLQWSKGIYQDENQWWWNYHWIEEESHANPSQEDLFLVGSLSHTLNAGESLTVGASLDAPLKNLDCHAAVSRTIKKHRLLIEKANLPRSPKVDLLVLACDPFFVRSHSNGANNAIMTGYPWFCDSGRAAMFALPGLAIATRRFDELKEVVSALTKQMVNGIMPNQFVDAHGGGTIASLYGSADVSLWLAFVLVNLFQSARERDFVAKYLPLLVESAKHYIKGATPGLSLDERDGLLRCSGADQAFSWQDARVDFGVPINARTGKLVELNALWYNFLMTIIHLSEQLQTPLNDSSLIREHAQLTKDSIQKFWNEENLCLFDAIETQSISARQDASIRANQIIAVSLPFRALTAQQEKMVLATVEGNLVTLCGLRSLATTDPGYQPRYGCGFSRADQYHRDLSRQNGNAQPWLLGHYCDAVINVHGSSAATLQKVRDVFETMLDHLTGERCLGSISEVYDGSAPFLPHGAFAYAASVAECMRMMSWYLRR